MVELVDEKYGFDDSWLVTSNSNSDPWAAMNV